MNGYLSILIGSLVSTSSISSIGLLFHGDLFLALSIAWLESGVASTVIVVHHYTRKIKTYEATIASLELKPLGVTPTPEKEVPRGTQEKKQPKPEPEPPKSIGLDDL